MSKWYFQKIWNNFYRWMNSLCVAKVVPVSIQTMIKLGLNIQGTSHLDYFYKGALLDFDSPHPKSMPRVSEVS